MLNTTLSYLVFRDQYTSLPELLARATSDSWQDNLLAIWQNRRALPELGSNFWLAIRANKVMHLHDCPFNQLIELIIEDAMGQVTILECFQIFVDLFEHIKDQMNSFQILDYFVGLYSILITQLYNIKFLVAHTINLKLTNLLNRNITAIENLLHRVCNLKEFKTTAEYINSRQLEIALPALIYYRDLLVLSKDQEFILDEYYDQVFNTCNIPNCAA